MRRKDNKVGNKTAYKRKRHSEKEESEKKIEKVQSLAYVLVRKTKRLLSYIQLAEIEVRSAGNIFFSHFHAN